MSPVKAPTTARSGDTCKVVGGGGGGKNRSSEMGEIGKHGIGNNWMWLTVRDVIGIKMIVLGIKE